MKDNIKHYLKQIEWFVRQLRDIKFAGQVLFVVIVLLISWSGVKAIQNNYSLQKQIASLQQQNQVQALQNNNLKLQNEYYDSNQYLELSARQNFGLAAAGEKELIVSKSVALAHTVTLPNKTTVVEKPSDKQPLYQRNLQAWIDFFLHRQSAGN